MEKTLILLAAAAIGGSLGSWMAPGFGEVRAAELTTLTPEDTANAGSTRAWPIFKPMPDRVYDTSAGPDEAAAGIKLTNHRWPDCETLETTIADIFRIEGPKTDQQRALALWRWFRILVQSSGPHVDEGLPGKEKFCWDEHKLMAVYGQHHCDGLGRELAALWRAGGRFAYKGYLQGHTQAELYYRDDDGRERFHMYDGMAKRFWWKPDRSYVLGMEEKALTCGGEPQWFHCQFEPIVTHTQRTALRRGETIERQWDSKGYFVALGRAKDWQYQPGGKGGVNAIAGRQVQTFEVPVASGDYAGALYTGSEKTAAGPLGEGKAALHAEANGATGVFIYRLAPPYPIVDAELSAEVLTGDPQDTLRISVSRDRGRTWNLVFEKRDPGRETARRNLCREIYGKDPACLSTAYDVLVKVECRAGGGDPARCGFNQLTLVTYRQLNRRCLPNLLPGENHLSLWCDKLDPRFQLEVEIDWKERKKAGPPPAKADNWPAETRKRKIAAISFPHDFEINIPDVPAETSSVWCSDEHFGGGSVEMVGITYRLAPRVHPDPSFAALEKRFAEPDEYVSRQAACDLARLGTPEALALLEKAAKQEKNAAILALAEYPKPEEATRILLRFFDGITEQTEVDLSYPQGWALMSLARLAHPSAKERLLLIQRKTTSAFDLMNATFALARLGGDDVRQQLERTLRNLKAHPEGRWIAAYALRYYPGAVPCLLEIVANDELAWTEPAIKGADMGNTAGDLRCYAIESLGEIGDPKAIDPLLAYWKRIPPLAEINPYLPIDESKLGALLLPGVRAVPAALVKLKAPPEKVVALLAEKLPEVRSDVRHEILKALGSLGGDLAIQTLKKYAEIDPEAYNRNAAIEGLKQLGFTVRFRVEAVKE
jgi:HEAT repeat protein